MEYIVVSEEKCIFCPEYSSLVRIEYNPLSGDVRKRVLREKSAFGSEKHLVEIAE